MNFLKNIFSVKFSSGGLHYLLSVAIIGGTALLCTPLANSQNYHMVSFILLFAVSIMSVFLGIGPVLIASTLSALAWNFFFIPPHYTFKIEKTEDILIFGLFFIIVLVNGILTTRVRKQEKLARDREKRTNALFQLTKELSRASGIDEVIRVASARINIHFNLIPVFILQDGNNKLEDCGRKPEKSNLSGEEINVAEWVYHNSKEAGEFTPYTFAVKGTYYPLSGTRLNPGVIAVRQNKPFENEQRSFWDVFVTQVSNAIEREFLGELAQKARLLNESERLYRTLFNSISHELRIPVATIMGASDSIINSTKSKSARSELCVEIFTASLRLNRLIENLLNMSRIESGHISLRPDWCDLNDLVNKVTEDLKDELKPFSLMVIIGDEMPLVRIDFGLMERILYNLILNATQYAPPASVIILETCYRDGQLVVEITDNGPGFPEKEFANVFKKFFRGSGSKSGGLGLGLSIVKGFVDAHNGKIIVENNIKGGAKFTILIPTEKQDMTLVQP
jgi:two-component system sensor histidine kinase KdpD